MLVRTGQGVPVGFFSAGIAGLTIVPVIPNWRALPCATDFVAVLAMVPGIVRWTTLTLFPVADPSSMKPFGLTVARRSYDCGFRPLMSIHCHDACDAYRSP